MPLHFSDPFCLVEGVSAILNSHETALNVALYQLLEALHGAGAGAV